MTHQGFIDEQLALIRRAFFSKKTDRQFFQERDLLCQAILFPAAHLKERFGVDATKSREINKLFGVYRRSLATVIDTIKRHGAVAKIERFSVYFLHAVQQHLMHHGEEYYESAKAARSAEDLLPDVLARFRDDYAEPATIEIMTALHRMLKSRAGRKKKPAPAQPSLF